MRAAALLVVLLGLAAGCRGGATRIVYAGPPIGSCAAGRHYPVPPVDAPTQDFIPLVAEAPPVSKPEPVAEPAADDVADPEKPEKAKPAKKGKKDKPKPTKQKKDMKP